MACMTSCWGCSSAKPGSNVPASRGTSPCRGEPKYTPFLEFKSPIAMPPVLSGFWPVCGWDKRRASPNDDTDRDDHRLFRRVARVDQFLRRKLPSQPRDRLDHLQ